MTQIWLHKNILRQLFCSNDNVRIQGRLTVDWQFVAKWRGSSMSQLCDSATRFGTNYLIQTETIGDTFLITATE